MKSLCLCLLLLLAGCHPANEGPEAQLEVWRVWLESPGGELPFRLEMAAGTDGSMRAWLGNGPERIEVAEVRRDGPTLHLGFPHYDSALDLRLDDDGSRFEGQWRKRRGPDRWTTMEARAVRGKHPRFARLDDGAGSARFAGRWRVDFESEDEVAVGIFEAKAGGELEGTFLTPTGDYRFLAGRGDGNRLRLSTFDGAHAFLFVAAPDPEGGLEGEFWSSDSWHETWTAVRDEDVELPDPFAQTTWVGERELGEFVFPDLDGRPHPLDDPAFRGKARILYVFGSWCPNCSDATELLVDFDRRYRQRGLSILGLAFEVTGDPERDARQVRRYARRHRVEYPLLLAGLSDKAAASREVPLLDRIRSYPTFVFLHGDGKVRAIYTGFSGPATGAAHERLRDSFRELVEELLAAESPP